MNQKNLIVIDQSMLRRILEGNLELSDVPQISIQDWMQAYALCPLDGRYLQIQEELKPYFSDFALTKYRVCVEVLFLTHLTNYLKELERFDDPETRTQIINEVLWKFDEKDYCRIKEIEKVNHHDVKSVEIFVAEKLTQMGLKELVSFVHFGCTSEDINNLAYAMMLKDALSDCWIPKAQKLIHKLSKMAQKDAETAMPAHTHGQKATPTTFGKEITVFICRLRESLKRLQEIEIKGKLNGATGNYAAMMVAYPDMPWETITSDFVDSLDLVFNPVTTQIEGHDYICRILDEIRHFNNVLYDFDWDMWSYISRDYVKQIVVKTEVGSSTMPQKVNPIQFENSASNAETSNWLAMGLSNKLSTSRMQRDLSDSSAKRNLGVVFGYSLLAIDSAIKGSKSMNRNWKKN